MAESHTFTATKDRSRDLSENGAESQRLLLERIVSIFGVPYYWGWTILAGIIFLLNISAIFYFENSFRYILTFFMLFILAAIQPSIIIWANKKMKVLRHDLLEIIDLPRDDILNWYEDQLALVFNEKRMFALGIIMNTIFYMVGASIDRDGFTFESHYSNVILYTDYYFTHLFMGIGLYSLILTAIMVYKIGRFPMNENIIFSKNLQIKGLLYSKFTVCAAIVYASWGCFRLSTPNKLFAGSNMLIYSLFGLLLLAYFILPQYSIHQMIISTKRDRLEEYSQQIIGKAKDAFKNPTEDSIPFLRNYLEIDHWMDELCVWPFGAYEILHIALIVIIPLIVVLLEIAFNIK